jgi:deoxycytidylate deaminase
MNTIHHQQFVNPLEDYDYPDSELVIGFVCAVGADYGPVRDAVQEILKQFGYEVNIFRVSDLITAFSDRNIPDSPEFDRISSRMDEGNIGCRESGRNDLWALAAIAQINEARKRNEARQQLPRSRTAHLVFTLKRPEEVATLRKVYSPGFFLVGVFATEKERLDHLIEINVPKEHAKALIKRDADEPLNHGQQTRDTFQLCDVFVHLRRGEYKEELNRFFRLVFADPYVTPTATEHAMFLAYAASLRSGQLGRQVGAAIATRDGDVLAVGCNDVPKAGGGLYWPGPEDRRDHILGVDTNQQQRETIIQRLLDELTGLTPSEESVLRGKFKEVLDITEFGRAVHAEMDALLTCARAGVSPKGAILYVTTFPCHNCTRHIIAAGIQRVIYIEPYAKSRAEELHEDAIIVEEKVQDRKRYRNKIPFAHFVGVGPRRYFDLFSLTLSSGHELQRKIGDRVIEIVKSNGWARVPLSPHSYIIREAMAIRLLDHLPQQLSIFTTEINENGASEKQEH